MRGKCRRRPHLLSHNLQPPWLLHNRCPSQRRSRRRAACPRRSGRRRTREFHRFLSRNALPSPEYRFAYRRFAEEYHSNNRQHVRYVTCFQRQNTRQINFRVVYHKLIHFVTICTRYIVNGAAREDYAAKSDLQYVSPELRQNTRAPRRSGRGKAPLFAAASKDECLPGRSPAYVKPCRFYRSNIAPSSRQSRQNQNNHAGNTSLASHGPLQRIAERHFHAPFLVHAASKAAYVYPARAKCRQCQRKWREKTWYLQKKRLSRGKPFRNLCSLFIFFYDEICALVNVAAAKR